MHISSLPDPILLSTRPSKVKASSIRILLTDNPPFALGYFSTSKDYTVRMGVGFPSRKYPQAVWPGILVTARGRKRRNQPSGIRREDGDHILILNYIFAISTKFSSPGKYRVYLGLHFAMTLFTSWSNGVRAELCFSKEVRNTLGY